MKLHNFEVDKGAERFGAMTRDRQRRALKVPIKMPSGTIVAPHEWRYLGASSTTQIELELRSQVHQRVRDEGVVVFNIPPRPTKFHAFSVPLDIGDIRVFSTDRNLVAFKEARRRAELGKDGNSLGGSEEKYEGEVIIPNVQSAQKMGVNYATLIREGFAILSVSQNTPEEFYRRAIERTFRQDDALHKLAAKSGVKIVDISVQKVEIGTPATQSSSPELLAQPSEVERSQNGSPAFVVAAASAQQPQAADEVSAFDKLVNKLKNNKVIVGILLLVAILAGVAGAVESMETLRKSFTEWFVQQEPPKS